MPPAAFLLVQAATLGCYCDATTPDSHKLSTPPTPLHSPICIATAIAANAPAVAAAAAAAAGAKMASDAAASRAAAAAAAPRAEAKGPKVLFPAPVQQALRAQRREPIAE